jgi:undecaprenyl diphosphate synthase
MPKVKTIKHLGIIMDGNRRWAKKRSLPTLEGHKRGYEKIKEVGKWCLEEGIDVLTVYAFSTENWSRSKEEVGYLMKLLKRAVTKDIDYFLNENIRLKIIGRKKELSKDLQEAIKNAEEKTSKCSSGLLNIAINYGGRAEIVDAVKKIIQKDAASEDITDELISKNIYTAGLPDADLIIRTSGEQRLSGFLLWQSYYSELYFPKVNWPGFTREDLNDAVSWFTERDRSFGGNKK